MKLLATHDCVVCEERHLDAVLKYMTVNVHK